MEEKTEKSRAIPTDVLNINLEKQVKANIENEDSSRSKSNCRISQIKQKIQREKLMIKIPEETNRSTVSKFRRST